MSTFFQSIRYRIKHNWRPIRVFYLLMGAAVVVQTTLISDYVGIAMGSYLFLMGLLGLNCASGNCSTQQCDISQKTNH